MRDFLLCALETGSIPCWSEAIQKDSAGNVTRHDATVIHPPAELEQHGLYPVHPEFLGHEHPFQAVVRVVYSFQDEERKVTIRPDGGPGADIRLRIFPSTIQNLHTPIPTSISNVLPIDLDIRFEVVFRRRGDGLVDEVGLQLELLDISGPLIDAGSRWLCTLASASWRRSRKSS